MKKKPWFKQKTTWVGIGVILAQVGGIMSGEIPFEAAVSLILTTAIGLISTLVISEKEGE